MQTRTKHIIGILTASLASLVYLGVSLTFGRLQRDLIYDDVSYANDAAHRLHILFSGGLSNFIRDLFSTPPHSPFSTGLGIIAILLAGNNDYALYLANGVIIVCVVAFLVSTFERLPAAGLSWIVFAFLVSPLALFTVENFRPDCAVGYATTAMIWWFIQGTLKRDSKKFMLAGVAFGSALLIKPTFFAHTLALSICLIAVYFLALILRTRYRANPGALSLRWPAQYFALGIAIAIPYFTFAGREIFSYFWSNTQGENSHLWSFSHDTSLLVVARTFLFGGYQRAAGYNLGLSALLAGLAVPVLIKKRRFIELASVTITLSFAIASFAILVFGRHQNEFFFSTFQMLVILAGFESFAHLVTLCPSPRRRFLIAGAWILLALTINRNLPLIYPDNTIDNIRGHSWNDKIVNAIVQATLPSRMQEARSGRPIEVYVTTPGPISVDSIKWTATKVGVPMNTRGDYLSDRVDDELQTARASEYVVMPNPGSSDYYRQFPSASAQAKLGAALATDPDFTAITPLTGDSRYFVFQNHRASIDSSRVVQLSGVSSIEGFGAEEGPYPQWNLPRVEWMSDPVGRICVATPGRFGFDLRFRAPSRGKLFVASTGSSPFDETETDSVEMGTFQPNEFVAYRFDHVFTQAQPCLLLKPALEVPAQPGNVLLFARLAVAPRQ
jgi:hypothetical protein